MPEPVTLLLLGAAAWAWLKGSHAVLPGAVSSGAPGTPTGNLLPVQPAAATANNQPISVVSGTGPTAPMATGSSVAAATQPGTIPADLVAALSTDDAVALRDYTVLNPDDFQTWLGRYSDRIELRNDLMIQAITDPDPAHPIQPTPQQIVSMGNAAYRLAQAVNGVAAGGSVDVFGVGASVAGSIPGMDPMVIKAIQGIALASRAALSMSSLATLAAQNGVELSTVFTTPSSLVGVAGAYPGLAAMPLAGVLMAAGLVVDIGMTIAGNEPDVQKAIDVALDVASLAVLFIPVIGVVIALVIQVVKFIIDLFGGDLFGGGLSHAQREALETARYAENINPMYPQLVAAYTPRELFRTIVEWGSGYCGGVHVVAMGINLILEDGDVLQIGGQPFTVTSSSVPGTGAPILLPPGATAMTLGIVDNGAGGHGCYALRGTPFEAMTNDEIAWAIAKYGSTNGFTAEAQVGIAEALKGQFDTPAQNILQARTAPMKTFVDHGFTLDQIDQVALEYRAQPHLAALAQTFGYADWQHCFADVVAAEWIAFAAAHTHGSLHDFAIQNGYPTIYAFRAKALAPQESYFARLAALDAKMAADAPASAILTEPTALQQQAALGGSFSGAP